MVKVYNNLHSGWILPAYRWVYSVSGHLCSAVKGPLSRTGVMAKCDRIAKKIRDVNVPNFLIKIIQKYITGIMNVELDNLKKVSMADEICIV